MAVRTSMGEEQVTVSPGESASCEVTVHNAGTVVDEVTFTVVGAAEAWTTVTPSTVTIYPGTDAVATVTFTPPLDATVAPGPVPVGIRAASREDPEGSSVGELTVIVGAESTIAAELTPFSSSGARSGRHELAVDNHGNAPATVSFWATDQDDLLSYEFKPESIGISANAVDFVKVKVKPKKKFWRGPPKTIRFQVSAAAEDEQPVLVDGTYVQGPLLPPWLLRALLALAALVLLLVLLWFTLLKPTVETTAKDAVEDEVEQAVNDSLGGGGGGGGGATTTTTEPSDDGGDDGDDGGADAGSGEIVSTLRTIRLETDAAKGESSANIGPVEDDETFVLTDVVFSNRDGDFGTLRLRRGDEILFELNLANFRDLDFHFVSPIIFTSAKPPRLELVCKDINEFSGGNRCEVAALLSGDSQKPAA